MVKRIFFLVILTFILFYGCVYAWEISDFQVDIVVHKDATITVTEKVTADFSDQPKHGIYRNIPIRYRDEKGNQLHLSFKILNIYDEEGRPWQYEESSQGVYKKLKIGDPNRTYQTEKIFVIKYEVKGAILSLENHDELFWNAIGTEWDAPIDNVIINVRLPSPVKPDLLETRSFSGKYGSRAPGVEAEVLSGESIVFRGSRYLPYEGLTIVVGWPKGIVEASNSSIKDYTRDQYRRDYTSSGQDARVFDSYGSYSTTSSGTNFFYLLVAFTIPAVVLSVMFNIWNKYGKDPKLQKSTVVEYKVPESLTPLEMGALIDDKVDIRDISASIIDLAVRGYLRIVQNEGFLFQKKYAFEKLKEFETDSNLATFEKSVLRALFGGSDTGTHSGLSNLGRVFGGGVSPGMTMNTFVELSSLENNFYTKLVNIKQGVFLQLLQKRFYESNPEKTVKLYRGLGLAVLFSGFLFIVFFPLAIALVLSGIIILLFSKFMPAKTKKGMEVYGKILGFEEFLMRTDKDKIQLSERQNIFEKMLPYAICLGIQSKWANTLGDIYEKSPSWFVASYPDRFLMNNFIYDLNRSVSLMSSAFISMPRTVSSGGGFGGGGFSGGGFGGGGGSSW